MRIVLLDFEIGIPYARSAYCWVWAHLGPVRARESFSASFAQAAKIVGVSVGIQPARAEIHKQYQMDAPIVGALLRTNKIKHVDLIARWPDSSGYTLGTLSAPGNMSPVFSRSFCGRSGCIAQKCHDNVFIWLR
jgi:hypothetical protein